MKPYLKQYWLIKNWTTGKNSSKIWNKKSTVCTQENVFDNVKWRPFCLGPRVVRRMGRAEADVDKIKDGGWQCKADSWIAPSQWETSLQSNAVSHWLGANLESSAQCHAATWQAHLSHFHTSPLAFTTPAPREYGNAMYSGFKVNTANCRPGILHA